MQLYFIRHGQSVNNAGWGNPNYKESPDPGLTEKGIEQAQLLADFIEANQQITQPEDWNVQNRHGFGITHLYSSLMERAVHTASYTAERLPKIPFETREVHESGGIFGRSDEEKLKGLPGRPRSFFEMNYSRFNLPEALDENGWWNRPFETEDECQLRAARIWAELLTGHGDTEDHIAIVSHGGFFVHLMCAILDLPWRNASNGLKSWFLLNNCSISRIDIQNDHVTICYLNRTDHLPARLVT